jgi:excisionase family DNA binding protein
MAKAADNLTVGEVAIMLDVSPRQVRKLITAGTIIATKHGRDYIIRRADLAKVPKVRKPGPKPKKSK